MKLKKLLEQMYYKQQLVIIDDTCNRIYEVTAQVAFRSPTLCNKEVDVFRTTSDGALEIVIKDDNNE